MLRAKNATMKNDTTKRRVSAIRRRCTRDIALIIRVAYDASCQIRDVSSGWAGAGRPAVDIDTVNLHLVWRVRATQRYFFGARSTPGTEHGAIARLRNRLV